MRVEFVLGPAGSGKTTRCLAAIRDALRRSPTGPPLLLLAPKQATFQLERQLLETPDLAGYTRLQILSFDRLAGFLLATLADHTPELLGEEGRVMVLRALIAREQENLREFHASARLPGFARHLSEVLRDFQRAQLGPDGISQLADHCGDHTSLPNKLRDLARLLAAYQQWLDHHHVEDNDRLLDLATEWLRQSAASAGTARGLATGIAGLWMDGFAEMTPQEMDLLGALLPLCQSATLAFCLNPDEPDATSWISHWSVVRQTYQQCRERVRAVSHDEPAIVHLPEVAGRNRFSKQPALDQLERQWHRTSPPADPANAGAVRLAICANPTAEAMLAAREIRRHVRTGGRFRDCAVLVRSLDHYQHDLRRVFARFEIPAFFDQREPAAHHPLAELTRFALRTLAHHWQHDDWFGALKTGLATAAEADVDWLENVALAHGWHGVAWQQPLTVPSSPADSSRAEQLRRQLTAPFLQFQSVLGETPGSRSTGTRLAAALRQLWAELAVEATLEEWDDFTSVDSTSARPPPARHATVWQQLLDWTRSLALAFPDGTAGLTLREWLPILEAGLGTLTVGVIPPTLDQVLVGAIDRSRNPELKLALVLGLNEGIFPAPPATAALLSEAEREQIAAQATRVGRSQREQIARERYYGYIACTRASERLVLTCAAADSRGAPRFPSMLFRHAQRLLPGTPTESPPPETPWLEAEHPTELLAPFLASAGPARRALADLPTLAPVLAHSLAVARARTDSTLAAETAHRLYRKLLLTSVSALEKFSECPFKFFVAHGLRAGEREEFETGPRERGRFQHRVLDEFARRVRARGRRWRDLAVEEASELVRQIGEELIPTYENGLFQADAARQFAARSMISSLRELVAALIRWMATYQFDPVREELSFGLRESDPPAWELDLGDGHSLQLRGKIDRVDIARAPGGDGLLAVVVDYKSSAEKLSPLKLRHGLQLQLLSYLGVIGEFPPAHGVLGEGTPIPAGAFYLPLRGDLPSGGSRAEVLSAAGENWRSRFRHRGRFDANWRDYLDNGSAGGRSGQFANVFNKDGAPHKTHSDGLLSADFAALLAENTAHLRRIGRQIFSGDATVAPYRASPSDTACQHCAFRAVCRFDPWVDLYRNLA